MRAAIRVSRRAQSLVRNVRVVGELSVQIAVAAVGPRAGTATAADGETSNVGTVMALESAMVATTDGRIWANATAAKELDLFVAKFATGAAVRADTGNHIGTATVREYVRVVIMGY